MRAKRNERIVVDLAIDPEELKRLYRGTSRTVVARARDGRLIQFPAQVLRRARAGARCARRVCVARHRWSPDDPATPRLTLHGALGELEQPPNFGGRRPSRQQHHHRVVETGRMRIRPSIVARCAEIGGRSQLNRRDHCAPSTGVAKALQRRPSLRPACGTPPMRSIPNRILRRAPLRCRPMRPTTSVGRRARPPTATGRLRQVCRRRRSVAVRVTRCENVRNRVG